MQPCEFSLGGKWFEHVYSIWRCCARTEYVHCFLQIRTLMNESYLYSLFLLLSSGVFSTIFSPISPHLFFDIQAAICIQQKWRNFARQKRERQERIMNDAKLKQLFDELNRLRQRPLGVSDQPTSSLHTIPMDINLDQQKQEVTIFHCLPCSSTFCCSFCFTQYYFSLFLILISDW